MHGNLRAKNVLIVEGSLLATAELQGALHQEAARPFVAHNVSAAFELVRRLRIDGAVIDHSLHKEAFDLCSELWDRDIPYVSCRAPHRLQGWTARKADAEHAIWKLSHVLSRVDEVTARLMGRRGNAPEIHSH